MPAIGKKKGQKYIKTWRLMEPLVISTLKAMTPDDIETEFFDDRMELIDYDTKTDLVIISVEMYTSNRAYKIAHEFRKRGIRVVGGGYHPTLMPEESLKHFDCVVQGNAEGFWHELLEDAKNNQLKKTYQGSNGFKKGLYPDRSIYGDKKYSILGLVETGRGCVFNCEFCTITSAYEKKYYRRSVEDVVEDIKQSGKKYFFFVDDNIVADEDYAIELFKALIPLKIKWSGQGSLTMARNDRLLEVMKASGCMVILIGYESMNVDNLIQMGKQWTVSMGERDLLTEKIHSYGIGIYATFVFGNEGDSHEVFEESLAFSMKHKFFFVAFNHLLPFPGTRLHDRLIRENKLHDNEWWLKDGYKYGDIPYEPVGYTPEELSDKCADLRRRFFHIGSILKRSIEAFKRQPSLFILFVFLSQNLNLRREVDEKLRLPVGCGLDEIPK
nr:radical SAM protein [Acidaminobacter sp. JC074]